LVAFCHCAWLDYGGLTDKCLYNTFSWNDFFSGNATILTEVAVVLATVAWLWILRQPPKEKD
ncbi:MAG: hypothetical protein MKZ93_09685, partial [Prochlorococcus sp. ALOHA_A2.0_51]|nr:hypothetical protein [Prochlorococcus sp. ALOHA_A2.0_51]